LPENIDIEKLSKEKETLSVEVEKLTTLKEDDKYLYAQGIALTPTKVERWYGILNIPAEELQKAYSTLKGKPLLKDHEYTVDSVIGAVEDAQYNNGVLTTVKILKKGNDALIEKIKNGLVKRLSAGFFAKKEFDQENGWYNAKNIEFIELSLVLYPADKNATLFSEKNQKEDLDMPEKLTIEQLSKEKTQLEEKLGKIQAEKEELSKEIETLKAEIERLKTLAKLGEEYIETLRNEVKKWIKIVEGEKAEGLSKIIDKSGLEELKAFKEIYEPKAKALLQNKAQETEDKDQFNSANQGENLNKPLNEMTLEELLALEEKFKKEVN